MKFELSMNNFLKGNNVLSTDFSKQVKNFFLVYIFKLYIYFSPSFSTYSLFCISCFMTLFNAIYKSIRYHYEIIKLHVFLYVTSLLFIKPFHIFTCHICWNVRHDLKGLLLAATYPRSIATAHFRFLVEDHIIVISYLPNPSARAGYDTRSIFKRSLTGFNSEFSFS